MTKEIQIYGTDLAKGVANHLVSRDMIPLLEVPLQKTWRADIMALSKSGEIWIVEVKSSLADFTSDKKWHNYLAFADQFFFAVPQDFPVERLPTDCGLIIADRFDAALIRFPETVQKLAAARRKALTLQFGRIAARRVITKSD